MKKILPVIFVVFSALLCLPAYAQETAPVLVLEMDGAISPAFSDYLDQGIAAAVQEGAQLLVIELDTPGGLLTSTRDMVTSILESPVPVAVWVTPPGAHAASAGTFILYASHIAAMDSGTNVGAATPIQMGSPFGPQEHEEKNEEQDDTNKDALDRKALEDTAAFIRGIAELRDRNADWAELAVTEARSITSSEALEIKVIDLIATSRKQLLNDINGRSVNLKGGKTATLDTAGAPVIEMPPKLRTQLLSFISDPNVAFILLTIGIYGLILEFYNPGTMIPGTIGVICLIAALFALNIIPVNATGIILLLVGLAFMASEAFVPSFGILGIGGFIAFLFGATIMFETPDMPGMALDLGVIWGIGVLGAMIMGLVIWLTVKSIRKKVSTGTESMVGQHAKVVEWSKDKGRVHIQGENWQARSSEPFDLTKEDTVLVSAVDGLTLIIRKE